MAAAPVVVAHHEAGATAETILSVSGHTAPAHHAETPKRVHKVFKGIGAAKELTKDVERVPEGERGEAKVSKVVIFVVECAEMLVSVVVAVGRMSATSGAATPVGC